MKLIILLIGMVILAGCNKEPIQKQGGCTSKILGYYNESGAFINETLNFPAGANIIAEVICLKYYNDTNENITIVWKNNSGDSVERPIKPFWDEAKQYCVNITEQISHCGFARNQKQWEAIVSNTQFSEVIFGMGFFNNTNESDIGSSDIPFTVKEVESVKPKGD